MSQTLRIRGEQVIVTVTKDGTLLAAINNIRNFNVTVKIDQKTEDYLGETAPQFDEIFNGVGVSFSMHMSNPAVFDLVSAVVNRAQRTVVGVKFAVKATLNFPNGQTRKIMTDDLFFGNFPIQFGSRADYGELSVDASGANFKVVGVG